MVHTALELSSRAELFSRGKEHHRSPERGMKKGEFALLTGAQSPLKYPERIRAKL